MQNDKNDITDPSSESRKHDHINLATKSKIEVGMVDTRFYYEPMLAGHPAEELDISTTILGKALTNPIWVSSMTGGTEAAATINKNLALACQEFGMGMGLGSCRKLLSDNQYFDDFDVRKYIGDQPLYANIGIAQIEQIQRKNDWSSIINLVSRLQADGLIIHINPLQEWLQPEGDRYNIPPIDLVKYTLDALSDMPIIVKEVGQGMGLKSLEALVSLPLAAIELAALGGTNFSKLELLRSDNIKQKHYTSLANIGHSALDMVLMLNEIIKDKDQIPDIIISGGVTGFLDGYYLLNKYQGNAIYGQASSFLNYAKGDYNELRKYVSSQIEGLRLAHTLLKVRT